MGCGASASAAATTAAARDRSRVSASGEASQAGTGPASVVDASTSAGGGSSGAFLGAIMGSQQLQERQHPQQQRTPGSGCETVIAKCTKVHCKRARSNTHTTSLGYVARTEMIHSSFTYTSAGRFSGPF